MDRIDVNPATDFRVVIMNTERLENLITWYKFTFAVCLKRRLEVCIVFVNCFFNLASRLKLQIVLSTLL